MAPIHALFGPSPWALRSLSALCGALLTPAVAWLGWEIAPLLHVRARRQFALWCGAGALALLWSQISARYAIRPMLFVLISTLLWASLWRAWNAEGSQSPAPNPRSFLFWALAGFLAGLSFYTYLPARLLPLILLPLGFLALWQQRARLQQHLPGLLLSVLIALLVAAPLGLYFWQNPLSFFTRMEQVTAGESAAAGSFLTNLSTNLFAVLGMFLGTGDATPRANLPLRPLLDPLLALPFLLGIGLALARFWRLGQAFLLLGLGVLLLPTVLTDYAPHFQRASGALPFVVLCVAYGADGLAKVAGRVRPRAEVLARALVWAGLTASIALTAWTYFGVWARDPALFPAWDVGFTRLAEEISRPQPDPHPVYISPRGAAHPTVQYLLQAQPHPVQPQGFDGRICMRVRQDGPARYIFLVNEDFRSSQLIDAYYPSLSRQPLIFDATGQAWAEVLDVPVGVSASFPELRTQDAQLADGIGLAGYWLFPQEGVQPGQPLFVRLFWQVERTPTAAYTAFVHLLARQADGSFQRLAGRDRPPGAGSCPTTDWQPGEMAIDELELAVPSDLPDGALFLAVGFYSGADGQRMPVTGESDGQILLGPLPVAR